MTAFIALLRAVNVGGTGKLPMQELKRMCEQIGFERVQTYIASGNVVFESDRPEADIKSALEAELASYAGRPVGVLVRSVQEIAAVLAANPFSEVAPNRTVAIFLDEPPRTHTLEGVRGRSSEELRLGAREIYVWYSDGMARSKLSIPAARTGTARNLNTVAKLAEMAARL